jgi:hypothetical protein
MTQKFDQSTSGVEEGAAGVGHESSNLFGITDPGFQSAVNASMVENI